MVQLCQYWSPTMVLVVSPIDKVLLVFINARLCSVGILYSPACIFWCSLWVLATNSFFWPVLSSTIVLDGLHLQNYSFLVKFILWSFCYLRCISICPCRLFYLAPRLDHLFSLIYVLLHVSSYYFFQ